MDLQPEAPQLLLEMLQSVQMRNAGDGGPSGEFGEARGRRPTEHESSERSPTCGRSRPSCGRSQNRAIGPRSASYWPPAEWPNQSKATAETREDGRRVRRWPQCGSRPLRKRGPPTTEGRFRYWMPPSTKGRFGH